MCLSMIRQEAMAFVLMRCCNYCSILRSSGSTVLSMVTKQMLPPITFDTGSAIKTPSVPIPKEYGRIYVSGTTMNSLRNKEKTIAIYFLSIHLKVVFPMYCRSINMNVDDPTGGYGICIDEML